MVALLAAVGVLALAGCTPEPVDPAAVDRWSASSDAAVEHDDDVLAVLSAQVGAGKTEERERGSVAMTFAAPAEVDAVEFSCFGDGTMSGMLLLDARSTSRSLGLEPLQCGDGPHRLRVPATWRHHVDRVSFGAGDSTADSAWQLTVRGSGGAAD